MVTPPPPTGRDPRAGPRGGYIGRYCRLQKLLKLALGVRETVAGRGLGALERGGGGLPMHPCPPPPLREQRPCQSNKRCCFRQNLGF